MVMERQRGRTVFDALQWKHWAPNIETLTGDKTLKTTDSRLQYLDPGGAGRNILLPPEADSVGDRFEFVNTADALELLTIKDDSGATTVAIVNQGEAAICFCDGVTWRAIVGGKDYGDFPETTDSTNTATGALKTAGGLGVAKNINVGGQYAQQSKVIRAAFTKTQITDNAATGIARITTPAADGGNYTCIVRAVVTNRAGEALGVARGFIGAFARSVNNSATAGVNSAVVEVLETASAALDGANNDILTITMTAVEASETQVDITFLVDAIGGSAGAAEVDITLEVEVIYIAFASAPTITAL